MNSISLKELKEIQLQILEIVDRFCREKKITYSLGEGSLLGAVRHKGFIPWDDDIDLLMPRPEYDRFVKEFNGYDINIVCGAYENDKFYPYPFAKVYHKNTILIDKGYERKLGVNIDIFPIDGFPSNKSIRKLFLSLIEVMTRVLVLKTSKKNKKSFLKNITIDILKIFPLRLYQLILQNLMKMNSYNSSEIIGFVASIYKEKSCCLHDVFEEYILLEFENNKYSAIKHYDIYLKNVYGNYMELPPEADRIGHGYKAFWKE